LSRAIEKNIRKNQKNYLKNNPKKTKKAPNLDWKYFYGKSYILPLFLLVIAVFSAITYSGQPNVFYYFTVAAYVGLAVYYYIKKPYLRIGKDFISTRRLGYDKSFEADQIKSIEIYDSYVLISFRKKRSKWVFAHSINRYPIQEMAIELTKFAKNNQIELINEWKGTGK
jgi:hypothetical protein